MMSRQRTWVCIVVCVGQLACSPRPTLFGQRLNDADSARAENDTTPQIQALDAAFRAAQTENEKAEALYRKAHALLDEHDDGQGIAILFRVALAYPRSNRAARAWLDLGRAYDKQGEAQRAEACYLELLGRHPSSGSTTAAAQRVADLRAERGEPAHVTYGKLQAQTSDATLRATLLYFEAAALQPRDPDGARRKFEALIAAFPLPKGAYSDEAQLRIALLLRAANKPQEALKQLAHLQKYDRSAAYVGSYTRQSYLDSYLLGAQILRDDLAQFDAAHDLLQRALKRHSQSAIVDDLYFELLLIELRQTRDTCDAFAKLLRVTPQSKYRRCAALLCASSSAPTGQPDLDASSSRRCHDWLQHGSPLRTPMRTSNFTPKAAP
ncbi:MAG TPA: tetratricopeptide repeat protein [Polyangiaceae bacterium]|nr:tetratricopeptide repeat protein [Polyangiaceae bacterium]